MSRLVHLFVLKSYTRVSSNISSTLQVPDEESLVGVACGIGACGVRFKKGENLALHRRCHVPNGSDDLFVCSECESSENRVVGWKTMALHLWNKHQIDTELYSCDQCHFRSFTLSRLQDHKGKLHTIFLNKSTVGPERGLVKIHGFKVPPLFPPWQSCTKRSGHSCATSAAKGSRRAPSSSCMLPVTTWSLQTVKRPLNRLLTATSRNIGASPVTFAASRSGAPSC